MRTHSPLATDVLELLESPGSRKQLRFHAPLDALDLGLAHVDEDLGFDLVLEAIEGGIYVQGTISGHFVAECRRCLSPVEGRFGLPASGLFRPSGEAWEEGYVVVEGKVDLTPLARDTVILELPANPLCREDCAGLCPRCGKNLNAGPCDCPPEGDARWTVLRELGDRLG